jgi:hypothetical protein
MENTNNIVKKENPAELMRISSDVAGVCRNIVTKTAVNIQGKKYVQVEGWQSIATAHGCMAGACEPMKVDGGVQAKGFVRRMSDGVELSSGYGFVGDDEKSWASRPEYARRAMAQTRAISRACRSAFSHVVVLMDSGLSTTPAEEVPKEGFSNAKPVNNAAQPKPAPVKRGGEMIKPKVEAAPVNAPVDVEALGEVPAWKLVKLGFGKYKGLTLGELMETDEQYAHWLDQKWEPKLRDDGQMWDSDKELKAGLEVAMGGGLAPTEDGAPTEGDDDVPF